MWSRVEVALRQEQSARTSRGRKRWGRDVRFLFLNIWEGGKGASTKFDLWDLLCAEVSEKQGASEITGPDEKLWTSLDLRRATPDSDKTKATFAAKDLVARLPSLRIQCQ